MIPLPMKTNQLSNAWFYYEGFCSGRSRVWISQHSGLSLENDLEHGRWFWERAHVFTLPMQRHDVLIRQSDLRCPVKEVSAGAWKNPGPHTQGATRCESPFADVDVATVAAFSESALQNQDVTVHSAKCVVSREGFFTPY